VTSAAFSPDGALLVVSASHAPSGGLDTGPAYPGPTGRLLALDGRTGALVRVLWEGSDVETPRVLLVDDRFVLAGGTALRVFERPGLAERASVKPHGGMYVNALALSPDGTRLASGGADGGIALWVLPALDALRRWKGHDDSVTALAFHPGPSASPGAPLLVSGGDDGRLRWFSTEGRLVADDAQGGPVEGIALSPGGDRMVVAVGGAAATLRYERLTILPPP
jgi:WD40 repeat protein